MEYVPEGSTDRTLRDIASIQKKLQRPNLRPETRDVLEGALIVQKSAFYRKRDGPSDDAVRAREEETDRSYFAR